MDTDRNVLRRLKRLENLSAAGGGGGSGLAPLTRFRFINGGTSQSANNGSIGDPYISIAAGLAGAGAPASTADATQPFVLFLTPALGGYTENPAFPAGRNLTLAAESRILVTGNATWANTTVAHPPSGAAILTLENIAFSGNFTLTDDGTAATGLLTLSGTDATGLSGVAGTFDSSATTQLSAVTLLNVAMQVVNCGSAATSASVSAVQSALLGNVTCNTLSALSCPFSANITVHAAGFFQNCSFSNAPLLTSGTGTANANKFDGPSWRSFLGAGGTRASGVIVLVAGGFYGGPIYGAALPTGGAGTTSVSLNGNGATAGYTGSNSGNVYVSSGQTTNNICQVLTGGGELVGDTVCITKTDLAANTLTVKNNAGTIIGVIPSGGRGSIVMVRAGATAIGGITNDWALSNGGSLAA